MQFNGLLGSCGMQYLWVDTWGGSLPLFISRLCQHLPGVNLIVFSDLVGEGGKLYDEDKQRPARMLADMIEKEGLGTIVRSEPRDNPQHGNQSTVQAYIWSVNRPALLEFSMKANPTAFGTYPYDEPWQRNFILIEGNRYPPKEVQDAA